MILGSYETTKFLDVSLCAILAQAKVRSAVSWLRAFVCVSTPVSKVFTFYSAGVAESQKDLESLTGEVSEMEKQVQLAGESRKKENDKFSRFYFAGGARTFGASCANEDTHHWLCKRTCRHAMGTVVCSWGANTNIIFLNPVSLAHRLSDAFAAITNGQQTLKNEMSNMTSQVCSRRRDLSQSRCDPGIPGLLKVPI